MNTVTTDRNGFNSITLKLANMRNEQRFTIYPYSGGDTIHLQSDKRFIQLNLKTGEGFINGKNVNYANSIRLQMDPVKFTLPAEALTALQAFLWKNEGKNGGSKVLQWENKELFSA